MSLTFPGLPPPPASAERRLGVASQRYASTVAAARAEAAWLSSARRSLAVHCEALRGRLACLLPIDDRAVAAVARWDATQLTSVVSAAGASLGAWEGRAALVAEAGGPVTAGARSLCALLQVRWLEDGGGGRTSLARSLCALMQVRWFEDGGEGRSSLARDLSVSAHAATGLTRLSLVPIV